MTKKTTLPVTGPIRITIKGKAGSGKSKLASEIGNLIETLGGSVVLYDSETPSGQRRWRKPYSSKTANVMIVTKQVKRSPLAKARGDL